MSKIFNCKIAIGLICIVFLVANCKKQEITVHENLVIDGNKPPTYEGVSQTQIEVYISKLYIDLLGLQATQLEITNGVSYLKSRDLRMSTRDRVIPNNTSDSWLYERIITGD